MLKPNFFFKLKIPKNIELFYCSKKKIIVVKSCLKTFSLKTTLKILFLKETTLFITNKFFDSEINNINKKKLYELKKILRYKLRQKFVEASTNFCIKLIIKGVGYKILRLKTYYFSLFQLKLGFSHKIFVKPLSTFNLIKDKLKIYVSGVSYQKVTQISSFLRNLKFPDPYKGKGILYENERIKLKQGKKT